MSSTRKSATMCLGFCPKVDAAILNDLEEDVRVDFIAEFTPEELAKYIEYLDSDDGADILYQMSLKKREEVIRFIDNEEKASYILDLLRYEEMWLED